MSFVTVEQHVKFSSDLGTFASEYYKEKKSEGINTKIEYNSAGYVVTTHQMYEVDASNIKMN